jgi:hypothetical protein
MRFEQEYHIIHQLNVDLAVDLDNGPVQVKL